MAQAMLQAPQWFALFAGSTQLPAPHSTMGALQVVVQTPFAQACPALHAKPQLPQFSGSVAVLVQVLEVPPLSPPPSFVASVLEQATSEQAATNAAKPKPTIDFRKFIFSTLALLADERRRDDEHEPDAGDGFRIHCDRPRAGVATPLDSLSGAL
jgi:hypothetical protein